MGTAGCARVRRAARRRCWRERIVQVAAREGGGECGADVRWDGRPGTGGCRGGCPRGAANVRFRTRLLLMLLLMLLPFIVVIRTD